MKGHGKVWILFDSASEQQTRPLNTLQAQITVLNLIPKDRERFYLWTPGWPEWIPLAKFLASDQTYFVLAPNAVPAPPIDDDKTQMIESDHEATTPPAIRKETVFTEILDPETATKRVDYGYYYEDFSADKIDPLSRHKVNLKLPSKETSNRRETERHTLKIEVILISKSGRTFKSYSQNISIGGTLLENDIPKDFLNNKFDLILVNKFEKDPAKGRLHFQGRVVGDYSNPRRLMFLESDRHTLKRLSEMLQSYAKTKAQVKKKVAG